MINHRHRISRIVVAAASIGVLSIGVTGQDSPRVVTTSSAAPLAATSTVLEGAAQAAEVRLLVNKERKKAGCASVKTSTQLRKAAQLHAQDMADNNYFSHTSRDGRSFVDRARAAGYPSPGGENIAKGQRTAASVMQAWMNSAGHRRNILNCSFTTIGVGFDANGPVWVQVFGR